MESFLSIRNLGGPYPETGGDFWLHIDESDFENLAVGDQSRIGSETRETS